MRWSSSGTDSSSFKMNTIFFSRLPVHLFGCVCNCVWRYCQKSKFVNVKLPVLLHSSPLQLKWTQLIISFNFIFFFLEYSLRHDLKYSPKAKVCFCLNKFKLLFLFFFVLIKLVVRATSQHSYKPKKGTIWKLKESLLLKPIQWDS